MSDSIYYKPIDLTYEDLNKFVLDLHDYLGLPDSTYDDLSNFVFENLDKFSTGDYKNYN